MDVIKNCNYIVDMGPEGGAKGGKIIAEGSVKEVAKNHVKTGSYTGKFLAQELENMKKVKSKPKKG